MFIPDDKYKIIVENTIVETVDIIVINDRSQILLWLRNNEPIKWIYHIPWGRRYKNELLNDSIKRKAHEELWIEIDINKIIFLGVYDDLYSNSIYDGIDSHFSTITYIYRLDKNEEINIKKDEQHSDLKFFNLHDPIINDIIKIRIKDMKHKNII